MESLETTNKIFCRLVIEGLRLYIGCNRLVCSLFLYHLLLGSHLIQRRLQNGDNSFFSLSLILGPLQCSLDAFEPMFSIR